MRENVRAALDEFYGRNKAHDDALTDRLLRWRNLEPDSARLVYLLLHLQQPLDVLEIGTSNGYAAGWIAEAGQELGFAFSTVEIDPDRAADAQEFLRSLGVGDLVAIHVRDAAEYLRTTASESVDFLLLDAERPQYASYWPDVDRILRAGGLLVVDNVISHQDQVAEFLRLVSAEYETTVVPTGAGVCLALKPR